MVDSEEVPRGGAVSEVAQGPGTRLVRTAFAGRRALCDDNHRRQRCLHSEVALATEGGKGSAADSRMPATTALSRRRAERERSQQRQCDPTRAATGPAAAPTHAVLSPLSSVGAGCVRFADYVTTEGRVLSEARFGQHETLGVHTEGHTTLRNETKQHRRTRFRDRQHGRNEILV